MAYNILLVDDSETTRAVIKRILEMVDIDVAGIFEAADGAAALRVLEANWVDIVFADLNMPGMDGIALINAMAKNRMLEVMPVVVVTSDRNPERLEGLKAIGAKAFLNKPFRPEALQRVLNEVLGTPGASQVGEVHIGESANHADGDSLRDTVRDTAVRVFEDAAFIFTDELPEGADNPLRQERKVLSAHMDVASGQARAALACSLSLAGNIAADLLGAESGSPIPTRKCIDAIGELLNMLAGMLAKQWFEHDDDRLLGLPVVATVSYLEHSQRCGVDPVRILLESEEGDVIEVSFSEAARGE